jgi:hypothetical protein
MSKLRRPNTGPGLYAVRSSNNIIRASPGEIEFARSLTGAETTTQDISSLIPLPLPPAA